MPIVGKKHFAYTPAGEAAAKAASRATGQPVRRGKMAKKKGGVAGAMRGASYGSAS